MTLDQKLFELEIVHQKCSNDAISRKINLLAASYTVYCRLPNKIFENVVGEVNHRYMMRPKII